jgi:hypothetical protein
MATTGPAPMSTHPSSTTGAGYRSACTPLTGRDGKGACSRSPSTWPRSAWSVRAATLVGEVLAVGARHVDIGQGEQS